MLGEGEGIFADNLRAEPTTFPTQKIIFFKTFICSFFMGNPLFRLQGP